MSAVAGVTAGAFVLALFTDVLIWVYSNKFKRVKKLDSLGITINVELQDPQAQPFCGYVELNPSVHGVIALEINIDGTQDAAEEWVGAGDMADDEMYALMALPSSSLTEHAGRR